MSLKLYINENYQSGTLGELVDMYKDENIEFIVKAIDFLKFERQFAPFTKRFNIPATPNNNRILKNWGQVDGTVEKRDDTGTVTQSGTWNNHKAIPATLYINEVWRIEGSVELSSYTLKQGDVDNYNIGFFGRGFNIKTILGDYSMAQLDWSRFDFLLTHDNVVNSWSRLLNSGEVVIPIMAHEIDYTYQPVLGAQNILNNIADVTPIIENEDDTTPIYSYAGILLQDLKPAYLLKAFVDNIFNQFNISTVWASDIDTYMQDLFILPSREAGKMVDDRVESANRTEVSTTDGVSETLMPINDTPVKVNFIYSIFDEGGHFDLVSDTYTPPLNGWYAIRLASSLESLGTPASKYMYMRLIDNTTAGIIPNSTVQFGIDGSEKQIDVYLLAGQSVYVEAYTGSPETVDLEYNFWFLTLQYPTTLFGNIIDVHINLPDQQVYEFLTKIFDTYNLLMLTNDNVDEVTIIGKNQFFREGKEYDLTQYLKFDKRTYQKVPVDDRVVLEHMTGEDRQNASFTLIANRKYGRLDYLNDTDFANTDYDVETQFTIFPPAYINQVNKGGIADEVTDLLMHSQFDLVGDKVNADYLLFYVNKVDDIGYPYYLQRNELPDGTPEFGLPLDTWGYYSQNSIYPSNSLARSVTYRPENPPAGTIATRTISYGFFLAWLAFFNSPDAKITTMKGKAPSNITERLTIQDKIIVNGIHYFIDEYKYNFTTTEFTLKLLKIDFDFKFPFPFEYNNNGDVIFAVQGQTGIPETPFTDLRVRDKLTWQVADNPSSPNEYYWRYFGRFLKQAELTPPLTRQFILEQQVVRSRGQATGGAILAYPFTLTPTATDFLDTVTTQRNIDIEVTTAIDTVTILENGVYTLDFTIPLDTTNRDLVYAVEIRVNGVSVWGQSQSAPRQKIFTLRFNTSIGAFIDDVITFWVSTDIADTVNVQGSRLVIYRA